MLEETTKAVILFYFNWDIVYAMLYILYVYTVYIQYMLSSSANMPWRDSMSALDTSDCKFNGEHVS